MARCCIVTLVSVIILLLLSFIVIFVVIPLIFKYSAELQSDLIFPIHELYPENSDFTNFTKYDVCGARNFYVTVNRTRELVLGVWHLLPTALLNNSFENVFNFTESLERSDYPVVIHFHGNGGNRIYSIETYAVLREFFHVIAFDYRCYGDSGRDVLVEDGLIADSIELYKWLSTQTTADIYIWGHSIGAAIATHAIAELKKENITPAGLFLEAPFTSLREEIIYVQSMFWFTKVFIWLPWYEVTLVDPFEEHGLQFNTIEHILSVDCPIMIFHAVDDSVIPVRFGEELYEKATSERNLTYQGNVSFHLVPALGFDHWQIYAYEKLPSYIGNHIDVCELFKKEKIDM